ncbi:MAG: D-alanine--D-alanine ligase [Gammaproteobacteria bacterium]|nr:D-alanine--D-alanine ligase [Gammaproteobacteria bacterium]
MLQKSTTDSASYVPAGMPALDNSGRSTSFFEFWPMWLIYVPVVIQWLLLAVRYRSLSLPLIANPGIPLSGMVGVSKSAVFDLAGDTAREWILPWILFEVTGQPLESQCAKAKQALSVAGLEFPVVGKPNIGCRGAGVRLLNDAAELQDYLQGFPEGGCIQFQKLSQWDAEAGVFYVRDPEKERGEITSLTLKYTPYVVGDGQRQLSELVAADSRAGELLHLYRSRHASRWHDVIAKGEPYRLVFSASHCRGAVFRDAAELIDQKLLQSLDKIFEDIPGFYYGRLDVKFKNVESLSAGVDFNIIEINGASSESINIWDRNAGLSTAIKTLLQQYHTLFKLGNISRKRGASPPGLMALYRAWRFENNLVKQYPQND